MRALPCCSHASTEHGPRAIPRRGSDVPPRLAGGVRCDARATRAAAMPLAAALNAPLLHGFSPVRRLRQRTAPRVAALLAGSYSPRQGTAPGPATRSSCSCTHAAVARQSRGRVCAGSDICGAEQRRTHGRARSALQRLTRGDCSSAANAVSEASFATGHEIEQRREPGAKRRAAASERRHTPGRGFASLRLQQAKTAR